MEKWYETVAKERKRRGWSREELARRTRLSLPTITQIEKGVANPRLNLLYQLSTILDVEITVSFKPDRRGRLMAQAMQIEDEAIRDITLETINEKYPKEKLNAD